MHCSELIVDGRGGISDPSDAIDPFEHVAQLEEELGGPLCMAIEFTIVRTTTITVTRAITETITLRHE